MSLSDKISHAELEVMEILWQADAPVPFSHIRAGLQETMHWEKSTVQTLLRRLADKGIISVQRREVLYYSPNFARSDYTREAEQGLLDRLYGGSAKHLVASLCRRGALTEADLEELRTFFRKGGADTCASGKD